MRSQLHLVASCLVLSILLVGCDSGGEQPPEPTRSINTTGAMLGFEIEFGEQAYESGDSILATLSLTNSGQESALVNARMAPNAANAPDEMRDVVFKVRSPSGDELPLRVFINVRPPSDKDFIELAAGESVSTNIDLTNLYSFAEPGNYTVQAIYTNVNNPSTGTAWKGQLASDVVTITVSD